MNIIIMPIHNIYFHRQYFINEIFKIKILNYFKLKIL